MSTHMILLSALLVHVEDSEILCGELPFLSPPYCPLVLFYVAVLLLSTLPLLGQSLSDDEVDVNADQSASADRSIRAPVL